MADGAFTPFLDGLLDGPLVAFLVGAEGLLSPRREPPRVHALRTVAWYLALLASRGLLLSGRFGPPHALIPLALVAAFALLRIFERRLALAPLDAACACGTLPAFLLLHPAARALPFAEFAPWLAGVLVAHGGCCALLDRFGEPLDRRTPFGRFGGVMLLLLSATGILLAATAFRGIIR